LNRQRWPESREVHGTEKDPSLRWATISKPVQWAKGAAREIYKDEEINNSLGVYFRLSSAKSHWFNTMLPRHIASWAIEGWTSPETGKAPYSKLPPFKRWRFALIAFEGPTENSICLAQEITGDRRIEVTISRPDHPWTL